METGVVIFTRASGKDPWWHLPPGRSAGYLPDSRDLWEVLWENRADLVGVAHSHPGGGVPGPSHEDVTTFAAVEAGLGKRLVWWITSNDGVTELRWQGPGPLDYQASLFTSFSDLVVASVALWPPAEVFDHLRELSL